MLKEKYPYFLANEAQQPNADLEVTDKYTGKVATRVAMADAKAIDAGIAAAVKAQDACRKMPAYERQAVLEHCVKRFRERYDELAMALCIEAGKPIKDARGEATRLIDTFKVAAEESVRIDGEVHQSRNLGARERLSRIHEACADRPVFVHLAVQFPAESGRA